MKKTSIAILTLLVVLSACKKVPEVNLKYVDVERDLITVGTTTTTVQCDYQYIATLKKAYFYYGEGEDEIDMNTAEMRVVQNTLYVDLAGLKESTIYSYYYEFYNGFNSMRTVAKTFKTEGSGTTITLPTVVTADVIGITASSAKSGGEVTNDGGAEVTERGICWSTNANPTLNDNHVAAGTGLGAFTAAMGGLEANTTYHVRAYATNEVGTAYGMDREFVTDGGGGSGVPEGAIDGLFSVSPTQKVYISKGNLQYQASSDTWRFAEKQWDYVGGTTYSGEVQYGTVSENGVPCDNFLISPTYDGWIDLFGWGTSGNNHGAIAYQPWSTSTVYDDYDAYGQNTDFLYNLYDQTGQADWGYNAIENGGNTMGLWRTLSYEELNYLFFMRNTLSNIRYVFAQVNGKNGVIVLPDDWRTSYYALNTSNGSYTSNIISDSQWNSIEQHGAVFLPSPGGRNGVLVGDVGTVGFYWSSTFSNSSGQFNSGHAHSLAFGPKINGLSTGFENFRYSGLSVRLVQDAYTHPSINTPTVFTSEPSNISSSSATCSGQVLFDGGAAVTEYGICWGTHADPTLDDNHVAAGSGTGSFSIIVNGLQASTTYHVCAYATNSAGTAYGLDKEFTTLSGGGSGVPEGAINGLFTINENGDQVYFSQGNLQYQASTNTWRFAEHQWDFVGGTLFGNDAGNVFENGLKSSNNLISETYNGWIDLFGWGTSGYDHGAVCHQPWSISVDDNDYYAYGQITFCLYDQTGQADWGYNCISNGGNQEHQWRTLSKQEWVYIFGSRRTLNNVHYVKAKVNEVLGVILLPDNWDITAFHLNDYDYYSGTILNNTISLVEWNEFFEPSGAVFLPVTGYRHGNEWSGGSLGEYWGSSYRLDDYFPSVLSFHNVLDAGFHEYRCNGHAVRLVQVVQ